MQRIRNALLIAAIAITGASPLAARQADLAAI